MSEIYSYHSFMFPFRFDFIEKKWDDKKEFEFYKENLIERRVDIEKLFDKLKNSHWEYKQFKINNHYTHYNEFAYFYDYVRDALYNLKEDFSESEISYYFEMEIPKNSIFSIKIKKIKEDFELNISSITLRIFTTGVGILSIELENREDEHFEDILLINDYGRRIYPQYISENKSLKDVKNNFLADKISIEINNYINVEERFDNLVENAVKANDIKISNYILEILDKNIFTQDKHEENKFYIQPILDDRMFVLCWYGNDALSKKLTVNEYYKESDEWYKYIFVDNSDPTVQNEEMKKRLLEDATYDRWSNWGTFYGISRYSLVCLTDRSDFAKNIIRTHIKTMYYQISILLLALRASILRFSDEIAALIDEKKDSGSFDYERLEILYRKYLTFYNRLYFKEISPQDQGIELYDIARKQMRIDEHIEKLDNKFTKLFEFANIKSETDRNDRLENISILGAVFLPPALLASIYGMNIFDFDQGWDKLGIGIFTMALSAFLGYLLVGTDKNKKIIKDKWGIIILIIGLLICGACFIGEKADHQKDKSKISLNNIHKKFHLKTSNFSNNLKIKIPKFREKFKKIC